MKGPGFNSVGDLLRGDGSNQGYHWETQYGTKITTGPAKDPLAQGGKYVSVTTPFGEKTTHVYDKSGQHLFKK